MGIENANSIYVHTALLYDVLGYLKNVVFFSCFYPGAQNVREKKTGKPRDLQDFRMHTRNNIITYMNIRTLHVNIARIPIPTSFDFSSLNSAAFGKKSPRRRPTYSIG